MGIKVLFLPLNSGDSRQDGVVEAFEENGCTVKVFDYFENYLNSKNPTKIRNDLIEIARDFQPDLIHLQIQHTTVIDGETIRKVREVVPNAVISNWTGDVRNYIPQTYKDIARYSDYNLISSVGQIENFKKEIGKQILYWQIGYNPKLYTPTSYNSDSFDYDAIFIGHYNNKEGYPGTSERVKACKLLRENFGTRFALYGSGAWPRECKTKGSIDQRTVSELYKRSICSVSVSHYNDIENYFSDRLLMCMASGRPVVCYRFPKYEDYFVNMCDLVIANTIEEIPDKVRMLKNNKDLANYIGKSGAAKVFAEHTYYSRVKELLSMLGFNGK